MTGGYNINATLLYSEINILCIVIMLIIAINLSVSGYDKSRSNKVFAHSVYLATVANFCDFLWTLCLTGALTLPIAARYIIDYVYFISFGFSSLFWLIYTDFVQKNSILKNKKLLALYSLPLLTLAVLLFINSFNGCLFYIDKSGRYYRGELFYAQQILSYGYIVVSSVKCFSKATLRKNYAQRGYFLTLSTFVIPPIICGIIQIFLQDIPVLSVGIVISYLLAYISSLERLISLDPLTGISNRRDFLQRLENDIKSLKADEELYFMFIDADSFKAINDTDGHNEGDRVLKEIATALKKYAKNNNGFCCRYGGDEFAVYIVAERGIDKKQICSKLENYIDNKKITRKNGNAVTVSMGYSSYRSDNDDILGLISRADEEMYNAKNRKD